MNAAICLGTYVRREACACRACARGNSPDAKRNANHRDALALLALLGHCIANDPPGPADSVTWGQVGDAGHVRERLMEIAIGFVRAPAGGEHEARLRLEAALCADDEHVRDALIDAT